MRLPTLEELRFLDYATAATDDEDAERVLTTNRGFRAFSQAASLRSVQYTSLKAPSEKAPSLASLTALFTLAHLTRLTLTAG